MKNLMNEVTVSGAIKHTPSSTGTGEYIIRGKSGQGWGLPVGDIKPEDFRRLADYLETQSRKVK
jgi:hypothetical protein